MKKIWILSLWLSIALAGCMGYVPGRQSYWDAQVREMCERDGGVQIIERVLVSKDQLNEMKKIGPYISIPSRLNVTDQDILFWDEAITIFYEANPKVWRSEQLVTRRDDGKVVARVVRYSRVGGDIPSHAHSSHFGCPEEKEILFQREKVFLLMGN